MTNLSVKCLKQLQLNETSQDNMVCTVVPWIQSLWESNSQFSSVVLDICFKKTVNWFVKEMHFFQWSFSTCYHLMFYVIYMTNCLFNTFNSSNLACLAQCSVSAESLFWFSCSSKMFFFFVNITNHHPAWHFDPNIVTTTQASSAACIVIEFLCFGKWRKQQIHVFMHSSSHNMKDDYLLFTADSVFCPLDIWGIKCWWNNSNVRWTPEPIKGTLGLL